jgi:hypothetical protein
MSTQRAFVNVAIVSAVALCASQALAQGRDPVLREVKFADGTVVTRVPIGGAIYLEGRELFEPPEVPRDKDNRPIRKGFKPFKDLTVKIDGTTCRVLASTLERITIQIHPDVKPGKRRTIKVDIKGRGSAKIRIDILSMAEWEKSKEGGVEQTGEGTNSMDEGAERDVLSRFQIQKFVMVKGGAGQTFQIEGEARGLPDGLKVELVLMYNKREIRKRSVPIKGGKFSATFGPYTEKMLVGNYAVELIFALNKQSKRRVRSWMRKISKSKLKLYKRIVRRGYTSVGGTGPKGDILPEDRARQEEELQDHVKQVCTSAQTIMESLNEAYAGAARSFFKANGSSSFDKAKYLEWLVKSGYAADASAAERIEKDTSWASSRGHFDDAAWAQFGRDKLIPSLAELVETNNKFNGQYIAPPNGKADELSQFLVSNIAKLYENRMSELFRRARLTIPDEARQFPFTVMSAPKVSRKYFHAKKRELLRTVGLEPE